MLCRWLAQRRRYFDGVCILPAGCDHARIDAHQSYANGQNKTDSKNTLDEVEHGQRVGSCS